MCREANLAEVAGEAGGHDAERHEHAPPEDHHPFVILIDVVWYWARGGVAQGGSQGYSQCRNFILYVLGVGAMYADRV